VLFAQLNLDVLAAEVSARDRISRHDAAVVFHFDFHCVMRQHLVTELEDLREAAGGETMIVVIGHPGLQRAGVCAVVQLAAAIDEPLRDMADFGDVEVRRNLITSGRMKRGLLR
jgi:hypothetical protein